MKKIVQRTRFISAGILLSAASHTIAGWFGADFSADIYQGSGQNLARQGSMSVSNGRVRTEMSRDGQTIVEIIDPTQGKAWMLDPQTRYYLERPVPKSPLQDEASPCAGLPRDVQCQRMGVETVNARNSDKWQLQQQGRTQLLWLDTEHHFPVRVVNNGQLMMEMRFLGREKLASRVVEKWQSQTSGPRGVLSTTQWYDPQLNIAIRQVIGNGQQRELRNIQLGPQAEALFNVPADYRLQQPQNIKNN